MNLKVDLGEKYELSIETIKPVHIRGEKYMFFDLWYDKKDNKICIADYSKSIDEKLAAQILENELNSVLGLLRMSAKSECVGRDYVANKIIPVKIKYVEQVEERINKNGITMIHPLIVPPSTVKGILRTALIYYILNRDHDLRRRVRNKIIKEFNYFKEYNKKINNDLKNFSRTKIESEINKILRKFILKPSKIFDFGYFLNVSFNKPPRVETFIGYLGYKHVDTYKDDEPRKLELVEFLVPGTTISYKVWTRRILAKSSLGYGKKLDWFEELFNVDNKYIWLRKESLHNALKIYAEETIRLARKTICKRNKSCIDLPDSPLKDNCYLVRIGYGSSHIYKTIRPLMNAVYASYIEPVMSRIVHKKWDLSTDKVAVYWEGEKKNEESVGWAFLCLG